MKTKAPMASPLLVPQTDSLHRATAHQTLPYQSGFGVEFETEAVTGALPGQNSPQKPPFGLFSELASGTTFSAPRALNRRTYLFRIRPSAIQGRYHPIANGRFLTPPFNTTPDPNDYGWNQFEFRAGNADFISGMHTICGNGSPKLLMGMAMHVYLANQSMRDTYFANADAEMIIVPQKGALEIATEMGVLQVSKGELALLPRGIKCRVELLDGSARGFVCENYGAPFRLPELGLIGSNGLANSTDFLTPTAAFEDKEGPCRLIRKYGGGLWATELGHSPLDVVAWRGNLAPCKYDMNRFAALGTLTYDHPDPSLFCALTSPADNVLGPNAEFMVLPPRWNVAEHTLRAPGFHRNTVAEYVGFLPIADGPAGVGSCLHNNWVEHGPSTAAYEQSRAEPLLPEKIGAPPSFVIESCFQFEVTEFARSAPELKSDYADRWRGLRKRFPAGESL